MHRQGSPRSSRNNTRGSALLTAPRFGSSKLVLHSRTLEHFDSALGTIDSIGSLMLSSLGADHNGDN